MLNFVEQDSSVTAGRLVSEDANDGALFGVSSDGGGSHRGGGDGGGDSPVEEDARSDSGHGDDVNHSLHDNDHGGNTDRDLVLDNDVGDDHHYHHRGRQDGSDATYREPHQQHQRRLESTLLTSPLSGEDGENVDTSTSTIQRRKMKDVLSSGGGRTAGDERSEDGREGQEDDTLGRSPLEGGGNGTAPGTLFNSMSFVGGEESPSSLAAPSEFSRNVSELRDDHRRVAILPNLLCRIPSNIFRIAKFVFVRKTLRNA